ncbi:related to cephalosporin C regulator 1 (cpcR1 gene) [Rhynchosporium agropyri]|uniref:Related to cephalosporin C regulator 1 (CpcR1 gene) n=1 Tax=Rhynchosporium agropyri TaxID=914238 RepID=A0A1E1LIX6_9HELO|nr:related to cephalosporin C regulator 1 (cpcR1 gene) [Rhynchosporium agropyri]
MDIMDQQSLDSRPPNPRSRSNTAVSSRSRKRPLSRASTTSIHSGVTQPANDHQQIDPAVEYHRQWIDQNTHAHAQRFGSMGHQMTAEDMVMNTTSQLQTSRGYDIDPSLGISHHHPMAYPQQQQFKPENARQSMPNDPFVASFGEVDSHILEGRSDEQDEVDSLPGGPAKKASKSSAANELEMRQLFQANKHRSLPDVATELHGNERGPQSERQRQVFAMLWINSVCDKGKGSVPRGRVYANYVSRCATERVTVLNPASFGKLVRVLFPGLKTRRLGVRGESKYHYVNFSLKDDQPELTETQKGQPAQSFNISEPSGFATSFNHSINTQFPIDRAAFPSPDNTQIPEQKSERSDSFVRPHSLYHQPEIQGIPQLESTTSKMSQRLHFAAATDPLAQDYEPISLPKIDQYLPTGTDPDSASALTALYRSHCTSLIDALRFCKEKTFFHLFTSFHGTLTMPVQKLFANPTIAPWIEECDFVMYQKMMRVVAPLTLQVAPKPVLDTLRNISEKLVLHIQSSFHGHPVHVVNAKVAPATLFAGLLDRELRVNLTAHAAANMLSNPANRDQMYEDWITMVRTRKVAECVPTRGMDDVVTLLLTELRDLLDPVGVPWEVEGLTPYGEMALRTGRQQQSSIHADSSTENVLDRWVNFLQALPGKFPYASHAEIVWCVQRVGTAVMRDLTIAQGKSFGAWWVTKCWIDEMIAFMAEQGGFMEFKTSQSTRGPAKQTVVSRAVSQHESRYSSGTDDFLRESGLTENRTSMSRPMDISSQAAMNAAAGGHDDSGIGIEVRTPNDDFMAKYEYNRHVPQLVPTDMNRSL